MVEIMAVQTDVEVSKILILVGAGYTSMIRLKNGSLVSNGGQIASLSMTDNYFEWEFWLIWPHSSTCNPSCHLGALGCAYVWVRVIVEKPFGWDSESSTALKYGLKQHRADDQIFKMGHYLGKELVENLSIFRFTNLIYELL